ncbi:bifunctional precorrin-2 dehydrogenase/sirohydrochlorin ferrochelatase [Paenibacillus sp. GCM10023252]|uniref:precorrin-2 dehydrogenase/sirohydrochlorin ferrochelatase family protein n=1 Tax=Paenibacillus sp. GCM10023252 TaxID=3252649 RepID=UPI003620B262
MRGSMGWYPILVDVSEMSCVVIGGGAVAERKLRGLLESGAGRITVVSPAVTPWISEQVAAKSMELRLREYQEEDVQGADLVIAAASDEEVNLRAAQEAKRAGALVNSAGEYAKGSYVTPAVVRRGKLMLTVTTSGSSPALAASISKQLLEVYGPEYEEWTDRLGTLREWVQASVSDHKQRQLLLRLAAHERIGSQPAGETMTQWIARLREKADRGKE